MTHGTNLISVVDTTTSAVTSTVVVQGPSGSIAVTPDGKQIYVAHTGVPAISVISTATNAVTATIAVANGAQEIVITRDGKRAYVTNATDLVAIDTTTHTVSSTLTLFSGISGGLAVTPNGKLSIPPPTRCWPLLRQETPLTWPSAPMASMPM